MKITLLTLLSTLLLAVAYGQTNVSGGIYSNTTWTLVNSPYIVTDTVVVFPGYTLTIEPGVVVKFDDNVILEMRQSTLIAIGNNIDSITFTSNSVSPHAGIWKGIYFNVPPALYMDYCNFKYAYGPVYFYGVPFPFNFQHLSFYNNSDCINSSGSNYGIEVHHCLFYDNGNCINDVVQGVVVDSCFFFNNALAISTGQKLVVTNSIFSTNQSGVSIGGALVGGIKSCYFCNNVVAVGGGSGVDSLFDCTFIQNHIGYSNGNGTWITRNVFFENDTALILTMDNIHEFFFNNTIFNNHVGIIFGGFTNGSNTSQMFNNNVCHNTVYNLGYQSSNSGVLPAICWCDTDSASIATGIYDGYDNITLGLLQFIPFATCNDSVLPSITFPCPSIFTGIELIETPDALFSLFPNPTTNIFTIRNISLSKISFLQILNPLGEIVYTKNLLGMTDYTVNANVAKGIYFVIVSDGDRNVVRKLIVE